MAEESPQGNGLTVLHFAYPWVFLLLILPPALRYLLPPHREPRLAVRAPFLELLRKVSGSRGEAETPVKSRTRLQFIHFVLVWILLVTAVARPQWLDEPLVRELPMRDLLVALDLSGSMETRDFLADDGELTDRLTAAKQVLDDFLQKRDGDRVGLIFFGSAAYVQVPFTEDLEVARELLDEAQVRMIGPRTVLGDAMGVAIRLFERSEVEQRVLIMLTDGNDTGSMIPPVRAAGIAADAGVVVHTIAMGDPAAAGEQVLDEETLREVAQSTGGEFFLAADRAELDMAYGVLDRMNPRQVESQSYRPSNELYPWPLAAALLLNMLVFGLVAAWNTKSRGRNDARPLPEESG